MNQLRYKMGLKTFLLESSHVIWQVLFTRKPFRTLSDQYLPPISIFRISPNNGPIFKIQSFSESRDWRSSTSLFVAI